jgi:hypothetical protein
MPFYTVSPCCVTTVSREERRKGGKSTCRQFGVALLKDEPEERSLVIQTELDMLMIDHSSEMSM